MKKILCLLLALAGILLYSCTDMDDNAVLNPDTENIIASNDELHSLIERTIDIATDSVHIECVDFVYPVAVLVYNAAQEPVGTYTVTDDVNFVDFLDQVNPGQSISISYPIAMTTDGGVTQTINNNDELKASLLSCEREEYITFCNGLFCPPASTCVWLVSNSVWEGLNAQYTGGYFKTNADGTITFYYEDESYTGTWAFLFAGDTYQLNINLEGTGDVATYWNHSYPVAVSPDLIWLDNSDGQRIFTRQCEETQTYTIGQEGTAGGTVFYDKGSYSDGWRYMEVANTDRDTLAQWGCDAVSIAGTQNTAIGRGLTNSGKIKAFFNALPDYYINSATCSATADGTVAAGASVWLNNNHEQWFLPSKEELLLVYQNLTANSQGTMAPALYWTSTEADAATATVIDFATGQPDDLPKAQADVKIRAVRYF